MAPFKMEVSGMLLLLLMASFCRAIAEDIATVNKSEDSTLTTQKNYNGWVNPEDLAPMPQCIAQQDQSSWLAAMKTCTTKRCTSHFGVICTHHQWLTQLSCLSNEFSPELLRGYLPYCGRSVLGKEQLYEWIRNITSRTWLVDVGDANELQNLSPASLVEGYADMDVVHHAPTCLADSVGAQSGEPYQHVVASCGFTSASQYIGRAGRPWEYSESPRSMVALGFETTGYNNLAGRTIRDGNYFDRKCFCSSFAMDPNNEPCLGPGGIDLTKERLWINATCGSTFLPGNWANTLVTTDFAYIPVENWHWPICVADMPKQVTELPDRCVADACEVDSEGYCSKVKPAVDRACFCRNISYDSCGGSCQIFETRIDYVNWLRGMCGHVQDWQGLPDNWRQLAAPTAAEMIPWRWTVKPSNGSMTGFENSTCSSNGWKSRSLALVNITTLLAVILSQTSRIAVWHRRPSSWYSRGASIATLQIIANYINALLVQRTPGYNDVPVTQLVLLWCSMPRLACLTVLVLGGIQPTNLSAAASWLLAEGILQIFSSYYMAMTVKYGIQHNFYFRHMERAERGGAARIMYTGALIWLVVIILVLVQLVQAIRRMMNWMNEAVTRTQRGGESTSSITDMLTATVDERRSTNSGEKQVYSRTDEGSRDSEQTRLIRSSRGRDNLVSYGTIAGIDQASRETSVRLLYAAMTISIPLLWLSQWLFWGGFIALSSEEFCPPHLAMLTVIWIAFSLAGAILGVP